jgi:ubiquinone/menaquinone biosynthesis C-methylase UbiE
MSSDRPIAQPLFNPLQLVEANFRKPTGWFGRMLGHVMAVQHRTLTVWAIELMNVASTDAVLDVGCGGGMAVKLLARRAAAGRVAGVDYSEAMLQQARARNRRAVERGQVEITFGDAMALPYAGDTFDKVCGIETFYFWPDPLAGLREVHRVLKPGGVAAIALEMSKEAGAQTSALQRYFSQRYANRSAGLGLSICSGAELTTLLTQAGFTQARYESQPDKALGWLCALARK